MAFTLTCGAEEPLNTSGPLDTEEIGPTSSTCLTLLPGLVEFSNLNRVISVTGTYAAFLVTGFSSLSSWASSGCATERDFGLPAFANLLNDLVLRRGRQDGGITVLSSWEALQQSSRLPILKVPIRRVRRES